jgi:uncharacterized protein (UPF0218 family)
MVDIAPEVKALLKKPLGTLEKDLGEIKRLSHGHRIISVGDVCTLGLLAIGVRPHLAVFDYRSMRSGLDQGMINALRASFKKMRTYPNPAGTVSDRLLADAAGLVREGGAVLIEGEEDLTALAFVLSAGENDLVVYGQPDEGVVVVRPDAKLKKRISNWLGR